MIWKIAICDDNAAEITAIQAMLERYARERELAFSFVPFRDGSGLLSAYADDGRHFDLMFLDVIIGEMNGIETARRLHQYGAEAPIVFFTTSRDYAVESYEVEAAGYLMKPMSYDKLAAILDRLLKKADESRLALRVHGDTRYLPYGSILFFESLEHSTYVMLSTGERLRCADSLAAMQETLAHDPRFYRCHKGYLVNMDHMSRWRMCSS